MNKKIEIIPAIDLIDGKCVRLSQGDYTQKTIYNENPLEVALMFEAAGIRRLHLVDLDGAKAKHIVNHKVLEIISTKTNLIIDFGGGLKSDEDLEILGADAKNGNIAVSGWQETTELPVIEFISEYQKKGVSKVISTDISRDGMLSGPAFELYAEIMKEIPGVEIIASGGIATMGDILKLEKMGVPGVITGKAIYENKISLKEIEKYNLFGL
jgi:phosphoribosylformimino-5-aminoimidazole carboxamide ribotide isomerase